MSPIRAHDFGVGGVGLQQAVFDLGGNGSVGRVKAGGSERKTEDAV